MAYSKFWIVREDWRISEQLCDQLVDPDGVRLVNEEGVSIAWTHLKWTRPTGDFRSPVLPVGFERPRLRMPKSDFAPDFFRFGPCLFASQRLRDAFAQPEPAVQYWPVDLLSGGPEARAQKYGWMNILACQPAVDISRSVCTIVEDKNYRTGETFRHIWPYEQMVLRDDLGLTPEVFRVAEDLITILATDALAERVQRAGCTGIAFLDPVTRGDIAYMRRYRTLTGVREEWTGRRADP
jgi:hypothetical protein